MRSLPFWDLMKRRSMVSYRHFGTDRLFRNVGKWTSRLRNKLEDRRSDTQAAWWCHKPICSTRKSVSSKPHCASARSTECLYVLSHRVLEKRYTNRIFFNTLSKNGIARKVTWFLTGCSQLDLSEWHEIFSPLYWPRLDLGLRQPASDYVTGVLFLVLKQSKPKTHS